MRAYQRKISGFIVLLMLAMQLLLAQHYTVHFVQDEPAFSHQKKSPDSSGGDGDKDGHDKICQVCVYSKSLSHLALFVLAAVLVIAPAVQGVFSTPDTLSRRNTTVVYPARGPPAFLS